MHGATVMWGCRRDGGQSACWWASGSMWVYVGVREPSSIRPHGAAETAVDRQRSGSRQRGTQHRSLVAPKYQYAPDKSLTRARTSSVLDHSSRRGGTPRAESIDQFTTQAQRSPTPFTHRPCSSSARGMSVLPSRAAGQRHEDKYGEEQAQLSDAEALFQYHLRPG